MHRVGIENAMLQRLIVQKVKHILDRQRQRRAAVGRAEDGFKQIVHELLERALGGEQPRQIDLGDHLVAPLAVSLLGLGVTHEVPHLGGRENGWALHRSRCSG